MYLTVLTHTISLTVRLRRRGSIPTTFPSFSMTCPKQSLVIAIILVVVASYNNCIEIADAFSPPPPSRRHETSYLLAEDSASITKERTIIQPTTNNYNNIINEHENNSISESDKNNRISLTVDEAKTALIELIPRMSGNEHEYRLVETYINLLEDRYIPVQTLDFLNLAMSGEWQLLFSTNLMSRPNIRLRLRELVQQITTNGLHGKLTNVARWEYAEEEGENDTTDGGMVGGNNNKEIIFDSNGTFSIKCSYSIKAGSRMSVQLLDHEIRPNSGSAIPIDIPKLVGYLHHAIPNELFDPNYHSLDTTYLDANLRIVRYTGPKTNEGVRNIFIRKGSLEISPTTTTSGGGVLE